MTTAKFPLVHPSALARLQSGLQDNLKKADDIPDAQIAALVSLAYVDGFLANLGVKGNTLRRLRNALEDACCGHGSSLLTPRRSAKPHHTPRQKIIKVYAALLMQLRMDTREQEKPAAKAVEKVLGKTGFQLSQGSKLQRATDTTVSNWRKGLTAKNADEWSSDMYRGLLKQLRPSRGLYLLMGCKEGLDAARKRAIKVAESVLKDAISERLES